MLERLTAAHYKLKEEEMSIEGLLIGLLYVVLYAIILSIVVYVLLFAAQAFGLPIPEPIPRLLWAAVGIIVIIMIVSLLFGWRPHLSFRAEGVADRAVAAVSAATTGYHGA